MKHSNKALEITIKLVLVKLEDDIKVRVTANADNARVLTLHIWDHCGIVKPQILQLGRWNPKILHLGTKNTGTSTEMDINGNVPMEVFDLCLDHWLN